MRKNARAISIATWIGIIVNTLLAVLKGIGGILSGSKALLADALHSASDIISSIIILFAIKIANKPPDKEHPYGHGKAENVASIIVALLLIVVGIEISISSTKVIFSGTPPAAPGKIALFIILFSILTKEGLFHYKHYLGTKYKSAALITDAWHHRSDSLSSAAALLGVGSAILGEHFNLPLLTYGDPVAGIVVSLIVIKVGYSLARESSTIMMEKVLNEHEVEKYKKTVLSVDGALRIDQMNARTHGSYVIIDIKISVDPSISVKKGHDIAVSVKQTLLKKHSEIEDVLVHVNPYV